MITPVRRNKGVAYVENCSCRYRSCRARGLSGDRACHPREAAGAGGLVLQGGVRGAAWLRGIGIKPMPKPGWTLETVKGKYATEYELHGSKLSEGVKEVVWSGGKLAYDNFDEFVTAGLKPDTTLYFPVVQECEQRVSRWIDIP